EARALVRSREGRCPAALRDLCVCALRYPDREDRARAAAAVAALLLDEGDAPAAREALLLVHEIGTPVQRADAEVALHRLSFVVGDELGVRRWRDTPGGGSTPPFPKPLTVNAEGVAARAEGAPPAPTGTEG